MQPNRFVCIAALCATALSLTGASLAPRSTHAERIAPNDNEHRAGHLARGVLTVALEARHGEWWPEGNDGAPRPAAAFAVSGGPLQTPGPLLRAPVGTEIRVTLHNALAKPMWVYGLGEHRGFSDSVQIAAGETREMHFRAMVAGISYYAARTERGPVFARLGDDSQLNGVIVIDPPGAVPPDHIFVISVWGSIDTSTVSGLGPNPILAFNGLGWPLTPRIEIAQGDTLRWRFVNVTPFEHPLHLHGSFFRVEAKGDGFADTVYAAEDRRMAVTELMLPSQTMSMSWTPAHSGNWIFHCHIASHATQSMYFNADRRMPTSMQAAATARDASHLNHMAALVIGIHVRPRGPQPTEEPVSQQIRLLMRSRANVYGEYAGYGFVRGDAPEASMRDSFSVPGPVLELVRGKRVAITLVNQSHEAAAVHWHGVELESFPDGVPGWSGSGTSTIPFILPGDSLIVRFTPPRAGTYMYHSHSNEMQQIASGMYGALIVRDGLPRANDERTLLFSDDGPIISLIKTSPPVLLNGKLHPDTIDVRAGATTRLRMINIRSENTTEMVLEQNGAPVLWRVVARDGADLPLHQVRDRPATVLSAPGQTFDALIMPDKPGTMTLKYLAQGGDSTTWQSAVIRAR
jgi:manganese oxidase